MLTKAINLWKRAYNYAAVIALVNCAAALGMMGYCAFSGTLNAGALRRAVQALRGETPSFGGESGVPAASVLLPEVGKGPHLDNLASKSQMEIEILYREAERVKVELAQRLALNKSILVQVENERDAFRRQQELQRRRQEESEKQVRDEGFERQVEIFQALSPKVAVHHLLGMSDAQEAAKILKALEPDRARKIIEAARRDPELSQMQAIVQKVRDVGAVHDADIGEVTP